MLHRFVRVCYVVIVSPAAFVAVGTGTALIFVSGTFVPWFTAKLFFVGLLVGVHVLTGLVIVRLFDEGEVYPVWRFLAVTGFTVLVNARHPLFRSGQAGDGFRHATSRPS